jgi:hypothetical protein
VRIHRVSAAANSSAVSVGQRGPQPLSFGSPLRFSPGSQRRHQAVTRRRFERLLKRVSSSGSSGSGDIVAVVLSAFSSARHSGGAITGSVGCGGPRRRTPGHPTKG